jgi:hypothetical protein
MPIIFVDECFTKTRYKFQQTIAFGTNKKKQMKLEKNKKCKKKKCVHFHDKNI